MKKNGIDIHRNNSDLITIFQICEDECRSKLIPWLREYGPQKHAKNENLCKMKVTELLSFFDQLKLWKRSSQATGHCKFKHRITKITVSFEGHTGSKNTSYISENHAIDLFDNIQKHVNLLGNEFFKESWSQCNEFDHKAAAERYRHKMEVKNRG